MENRRGEVDAVTDLILGAPKSLWMVIAAMKLRHLILEEQLWQPLRVFLPGEFHGQRSLAGHSSWGHEEWDTTLWFTHTHTHTVGGLLRSGDYSANRGRHGEEKTFVAALSLHPKKLGRQVRNVWKISSVICHGVWQQFCPVSLQPLTMALAFHFSIGQYKYIKF